MAKISLHCVIDGQSFTTQQLDAVEYARHIHVLHEMKRLGAPMDHDGRTLEHDDINLLSAEQARDISIAIRCRLGPDGARDLFKSQLNASDDMWKKTIGASSGAPMLIGETDLTINGITHEAYRKAVNFDRFREIYPIINPDHYFAYQDERGFTLMEVFGMYGGPCELYVHPDQTINAPVERLVDYPLLVAGFVTLRDGTNPNMLAYHQFMPMEDGFKVKLCCAFPPDTAKEIVDGHKLHMAIEVWRAANLAIASTPIV